MTKTNPKLTEFRKRPMTEVFPVEDWMLPYFDHFNNTGGNDVVELLHDDTTTAHANIIRYLLIQCVRSQYTFLVWAVREGVIKPGEE